jgi:hypothetical protein
MRILADTARIDGANSQNNQCTDLHRLLNAAHKHSAYSHDRFGMARERSFLRAHFPGMTFAVK